jgi:DNA-binding PadR family transcriptional regulator
MTADLKDPAYWDTAILRASGRLFMLAALTGRPAHGYEIARRLSGLCGDWCKPSDAMIYPAIRDLEAAGLIQCELDESSARKRRVCQLTVEGERALRVGAEAWDRFLPAITQVIAEAGVEPGAGCPPSPSGGAGCGSAD